MNETSISRAYRDTRLGSIGGGADEIMLSIICKHMGIRRGNGTGSTARPLPAATSPPLAGRGSGRGAAANSNVDAGGRPSP